MPALWVTRRAQTCKGLGRPGCQWTAPWGGGAPCVPALRGPGRPCALSSWSMTCCVQELGLGLPGHSAAGPSQRASSDQGLLRGQRLGSLPSAESSETPPQPSRLPRALA